jgi:hypothetical protein
MAAPALLIAVLVLATPHVLCENNNKKLYKMQMETPQKFVLIEGSFTPAEAKEVITNLLESKIQFHSRENFSSEIRYGKRNEISIGRRDQLLETKKDFSDFISSVPPGQQLHIRSVINIE